MHEKFIMFTQNTLFFPQYLANWEFISLSAMGILQIEVNKKLHKLLVENRTMINKETVAIYNLGNFKTS